MTTSTVPGSLMAVRKEAARTLRRARAFFTASGDPKKEALRECADMIGQARGALTAIRADTLVEQLRAVETRMSESAAGVEPWENLRRMLSGNLHRVERQLRALSAAGKGSRRAQLNGGERALENARDALALEPPLREARQLYERGLLHMLRDRADQASLSQMLGAAQIVLTLSRGDVDREFWNVCAAVIEAMMHGGVAVDTNGKRFCARLNLILSRLPGADGLSVPLPFAEALKILDASRPVTARIQSIQLGAALPPAAVTASDSVAAPADPQLAAQVLKTLREYLERFAAGEYIAVSEFRHVLSGGFKEDLDHTMPSWLGDQMLLAANRFDTPDRGRSIERAALALVFMEAELAGADRAQDRADRFSRWLTEVQVNGVSGGARAVPLPSDLIHVPVAFKTTIAAMRARMRVAEQLLEEYFGGSMDPTLAGSISECLNQIAGAMKMLGAPVAAAAIRACESRLQRIGRDALPATLTERDQLVEAFCAVGAYVDGIEEDADHVADLAPEEWARNELAVDLLTQSESTRSMESATAVTQAQAAQLATPATTRDIPAAPGNDADDRLAVFVEEAESVIAELTNSLRSGAQVLANKAVAADVRRAFHTLKGSSRMVGLQQFSDASWRLEQVFDRWVDQRQGSALELYRLATYSLDVLSRSVAALSGQGPVNEELGEIERLAQRLIDGETLADAALADKTVAEAPVASADAALAATEISVPPANLSDIYAREAGNHLALLRRAGEELEADPDSLVRSDMVRAAHTLASASATMRFSAVNELAAALELFLANLVRVGVAPPPRQLDLVRSATRQLEELIRLSLDGNPAAVESDLIATLRQLELAGVEAAVTATESLLESSDAPAAAVAHEIDPDGRVAVVDDFDYQLLPSFLGEADELLPLIGAALRALRANAQDHAAAANLLRRLHTLKGSARMAGAMAVGALIHQMESSLRSGRAQQEFSGVVVDELETTCDRVSTSIENLRARRDEVVALPTRRAGDVEDTLLAGDDAAVVTDAARFPQLLRVDVSAVDRLVNDSGEMVVARAGIERELHALDAALREQTESLARLRAQFNELEIQAESQLRERPAVPDESAQAFDPLEFDRYTRLQELTRMMAETVSDLSAIKQNMAKSVDSSLAALVTQSRVTKKVQKDLVAMRMVPFSTIAHRLYRVVRQAAKDARKRANLDIIGGEVRVDRSVLDRVTAPLEHLLRNSIAHGLEHAAQREASGKPEIGQISLHVSQEAGEIEIVHRDDGAGLDLARIREQAIARHLMSASEQRSAASLTEFIFLPGFSTVSTTTDLAGRGVGLDVVQTEIRLLGGRIDVASQAKVETLFTIRLPVTIAMSKTLVVAAERALYALPAHMVRQVMLSDAQQIRAARASGHIDWRGQEFRMGLLPHALERDGPAPNPAAGAIILVADRDDRWGLEVASVIGQFDLIIKSIGTQFARVSGVTGAAILPGGEVVLALNPFLARMPAAMVTTAEPAVTRARATRRALVVDDSLTVRQITGRLLAKDGFEVATAKDGIDALEKIRENPPDLIVLDIEMPRMDGFELMRTLRADAATRDFAILVITSRSAQKHRQHAMESGANEFLGKPYSDDELLATVHALEAAHAVRAQDG